jgi:hypothetical protein
MIRINGIKGPIVPSNEASPPFGGGAQDKTENKIPATRSFL